MSTQCDRINVASVVNTIKSHYSEDYEKLTIQLRQQMTQQLSCDFSPHEVIAELIRFLYIKKHSSSARPPTLIDEAWKLLLQIPKFYCQVCGYIARDGADGASDLQDIIDRSGSGSYERTLERYREYFPNSSSVTHSVIWNEELFNRLLNAGPPRAHACRTITVHIRELHGRVTLVTAVKDDTIENLMDSIQDSMGIPPDQQRLIFNKRQLSTDEILEDIGVTDGSVIHLVLKLRGC